MVNLYSWVKGKPSTSRAYLEDSYVKELNVRVLDYVLEKGNKYYVVFDKTIFHPRSGGQSSDTGFVVGEGFEFEVLKVLEFGEVIVHYGRLINGSLEKDMVVRQLINWNHRYYTMRLHTAGHILDYAVMKNYGGVLNTLDANHGPPESYVVYEAEFLPESRDLPIIENYANDVVESSRPVKTYWAEPWELTRRTYNAPNLRRLPARDRYRVVEIEGINAIPCTGTHVINTREVGYIEVTRIVRIKNGFKLYYNAL